MWDFDRKKTWSRVTPAQGRGIGERIWTISEGDDDNGNDSNNNNIGAVFGGIFVLGIVLKHLISL